tara:strand:- start:1531 stop:2004 length:474 start_codon:yes stop_codon:yes gene_type:complete
MNIEVKKINIHREKNLKLIENILKNWFTNPKNLNFSEPHIKYPFSFRKWIKKFYQNKRFQGFFLIKKDWIISFIIIEYLSHKKIHIKHTSCKPNYKEKGKNLIYFINYFLKTFDKETTSQIIINVVKNDNILAEALLENGFVRKREERLTNQYQKKL